MKKVFKYVTEIALAYWDLRILDIHDFISDMALLHTKNKAVSLKVANSVVHAPNLRIW